MVLPAVHTSNQQRILELNGVKNLRDIGGYPTVDGRRTRWRTLYRSACPDRLDAAGQRSLIQAGLRTVIDLRGHDELAERRSAFASSSEVSYMHLPFFDGPPPDGFTPNLHLGYRGEVDQIGGHLVRIIETLTTPGGLPALINCAAGKDRTGVAIGVVLAAVGTQREAIAEDYALSEACLGPDLVETSRAWVLSKGYDWSAWEHVTYTPPERMLHTLDYLDTQYGGVEAYLLRHGLAPNMLSAVRELLTEPEASPARAVG